ncbi:unnamed protein product [Phytophthora lilii]|uniref:Unnamed protein product n=1 Tax=Phytophthora lilii TaxID=2077276 RepID=A0A9W7CQ12_9STRA|nr:unnamed protein product [Phytophthora lilii]
MPSGWQLSKCEAIGKSKNWGKQTGKRSGITVIDVDIKNNKNGMDSLVDVVIDLDDYQTYKVRTCSGGYHYYFKYDERFKTSANVLPGVNVRNDNGCVFARERYEVVNDVEPVDIPEELYEALYQCKENTYEIQSPICGIHSICNSWDGTTKGDIEYKDEIFSLKILDILLAVKKSINYKKVVLEPYGAFDRDDSSTRFFFNLFSGLVHKYESDFVVDNSIVDVWLTHLQSAIANNDEAVYNYLLKYFKHILVNPMEKTGTVIIIKGKQGSGKNAAFDVFNRYVLNPNLSLTTPRMDLITGRFNSIRQSQTTKDPIVGGQLAMQLQETTGCANCCACTHGRLASLACS